MRLTKEQDRFYENLLSWYHREYHSKPDAKIVVGFTGGRAYKNAAWVNLLASFFHVYSPRSSNLIYHVGDCPTGVDKTVRDYVCRPKTEDLWCRFVHRADWEAHGKAAGPIRNGEMLRSMKADSSKAFLVAFDGGNGTKDCVKQCARNGMPVIFPDGIPDWYAILSYTQRPLF